MSNDAMDAMMDDMGSSMLSTLRLLFFLVSCHGYEGSLFVLDTMNVVDVTDTRVIMLP